MNISKKYTVLVVLIMTLSLLGCGSHTREVYEQLQEFAVEHNYESCSSSSDIDVSPYTITCTKYITSCGNACGIEHGVVQYTVKGLTFHILSSKPMPDQET